MLLRKDDPLVPLLKQRGELFVLLDENPTAENIAKLIFDHAHLKGLPVVEVRLWETPTSYATYRG
jgi:6-pyruvoyltetrahydropterin/6-carboxytetrahydropterin synthase